MINLETECKKWGMERGDNFIPAPLIIVEGILTVIGFCIVFCIRELTKSLIKKNLASSCSLTRQNNLMF